MGEIESREISRGGQVLFGFMLPTTVRILVNLFIWFHGIIIMRSKPSLENLHIFTFHCMQLRVHMVSCDWQEVTLPMKAELRSAWTTLGVLCVMTPGEVLMLLLCVVNWDIQLKVTYWVYQKNAGHCGCKPEQMQTLNLPAFNGAWKVKLVVGSHWSRV